ncbi:MAG: hypothetical protein C4308_04005 [Chitinophagaceae bacterium]
MIESLSKTTALNEKSSLRPHYPALDGLRGLAILLVVFLHNFGFLHYFFFGWLGVDLFFVLSGFLITEILLNSLEEKNFLGRFYIRRVLRIFPVYFLTLAFCIWVIPQLTTFQMTYYRQNAGWFITFLQNWLFIFNPPQGNSTLLHFWSLAVEEQFYLFWPWIILLLRKPKRLQWFLVSLLVGVMLGRYLLWILHIENLAYDSFYTFTRIDGICVGSLIAILLKTHPDFFKKYTTAIVLSLAALNFLMYFINRNAETRLPFLAFIGYTTFAIMFGFLLHECITAGSKLIKLLFANHILRFFGRISYGLYVYHWPVYLLLTPVFNSIFLSVFGNENSRLMAASICSTMASIVISTASFYFLEKPFLKLKTRFS